MYEDNREVVLVLFYYILFVFNGMGFCVCKFVVFRCLALCNAMAAYGDCYILLCTPDRAYFNIFTFIISVMSFLCIIFAT